MNLIDFTLLAQGSGWEIGPNLLSFLTAAVPTVASMFAAYLAYRSILASKGSRVEARRARRVSVKAAVAVEDIKTAVAALPEIKKDVNSNFTKQEEARKLSDKRLEEANEKIGKMSELLINAKTEQIQADRDRAVVQKVNGAKPAEPTAAPAPVNIVNVEKMDVAADSVSIDQKEKKSG